MTESQTMLTAEWFKHYREAIEKDESFKKSMRYFDGAVIFQSEEVETWVKIYRGELIEILDHEPPFGATFRIQGDQETWERLLTQRERNPFGEQLTNDDIKLSGNVLESTRVMDGINALVSTLREETSG